MGVPKFFRYISERYPCLSEYVNEYQIPEFDNLYLDMNGIIHICSHPDDGDAHFRITEEKIFQDVFHYIESLFRMIKPGKLFFMAIDGVAPRAKMNQQRGRRFRTAQEAKSLEEKALANGEVLPTEARFDSNCITPGTEFMARLHEQLKYFVVSKISTDKLWQRCKVILSGHETPGEGEHKIMDYIRYMRSQPGYDPNTRHCLYGLDADLIMLGLCTHEPHFSLLREEVRFGKKQSKRKNIPEETPFFLLHLSLMREYLELEFLPVKETLPFEYDIEKIIDDWVLMGFLVGNDFIPNLPNMHIANGVLPVLHKAYMNILPSLGGYINEGGTLNLERFEKFMQKLAELDMENFTEVYADLKWFEGKTGRKFDSKTQPINEKPVEDTSLAALIKATDDLLDDIAEDEICSDDHEESDIQSDVSDSDDDLIGAEFLQHKNDYYMNKLAYSSVTPEVLRDQAEGYVRAIQWNLHYYYNGVCSWSWFYPHHYAPYVSDINGFANLKLDFNLGTPFKPYEQLLAVLPAASKTLLPQPFQELMTEENSPIKNFYPEDFQTDLNGKKQEWEAVVLIPFIDEEALLKAMTACLDRLTEEEKLRNMPGPMLVYEYTPDDLGSYPAPEYFPELKESHGKCTPLSIEDIRVPIDKLIKGAYPGVKFDVYYPGFPTMKHLKYTGTLEKAKVRVFEQPSRSESMILRVIHESKPIETVAGELLGKIVHVKWPHLIEAKVISVSNKERRINLSAELATDNTENNKLNQGKNWFIDRQGVIDHYKNRLGIDVTSCSMVVHVNIMIGRKYIFSPQGRISLEKQWSPTTSIFPIETVVSNIKAYEEKFAAYKDIYEVFPVGCDCFLLGHPNYGSMGKVLEDAEALKKGRIAFSALITDEPDLGPVFEVEDSVQTRYMSLHTAASKLAISKGLFSKITGTLFVGFNSPSHSDEPTRDVNIGLSLKFNKRNEEVPGYTRRDGNVWFYSDKTVDLVRVYMERFPEVFTKLNHLLANDVILDTALFPDGNGKEKLKEITVWIKKQSNLLDRKACGSAALDPETVQKLEEVIDHHFSKKPNAKTVTMLVKPHVLYKPEFQMGHVRPDPTTKFRLCDRVINAREGCAVPLGFMGTIIAMYKSNNSENCTYDIVFDKTFTGGLTLGCSPNRGYKLSGSALISLSHGQRMFEQKVGKRGGLNKNVQRSETAQNFHQSRPPPHPANFPMWRMYNQPAPPPYGYVPPIPPPHYSPMHQSYTVPQQYFEPPQPHFFYPPQPHLPSTFVPYRPQYQPPQKPFFMSPNQGYDFMPNFDKKIIKSKQSNKDLPLTDKTTEAIETELKKLLNIGNNGKNNKKKVQERGENEKSVPFSVQDFFKAASHNQNQATSSKVERKMPPHPPLPAPPENWRDRSTTTTTTTSKTCVNSTHRCPNTPKEKKSGYAPSSSKEKHSKSTNRINLPFVPLQAVRKQRNRTVSAPVAKPQEKTVNDSNNSKEAKKATEQQKSPQSKPTTSEKPTQKTRRERKMRIAANFQKSMMP